MRSPDGPDLPAGCSSKTHRKRTRTPRGLRDYRPRKWWSVPGPSRPGMEGWLTTVLSALQHQFGADSIEFKKADRTIRIGNFPPGQDVVWALRRHTMERVIGLLVNGHVRNGLQTHTQASCGCAAPVWRTGATPRGVLPNRGAQNLDVCRYRLRRSEWSSDYARPVGLPAGS